MSQRSKSSALAVLAVFVVLSFASPALAVQKKPKKKATPRGTPVLWRERKVESLDLYAGPGGRRGRPNLRRLTFLEEEKGGWSTKYRVRDASGRVWVAKIGKEAQSETASTRLLWAAGYIPETTYLAPRATIPDKGTFQNVRFEARPTNIKRLDEWKWEQNPFVGTKEFQGLKVMMVLLNNWDIKDSNNVVLHARDGRASELRYAISDLGATLGETGGGLFWRITRSRNDPEGFSEDKFIEKVRDDGRVDFHFSGKKSGMLEDITVDQARWVGEILSRLSDGQLHEAFRAANYTPAERRTLVSAVRSRINQLANLRR